MRITIKPISLDCKQASFRGPDDSVTSPSVKKVIILLESILIIEGRRQFNYQCNLAFICQTSQGNCPYK